MFEVDVKNVTEEMGRRGGGDQLGFGVLMMEKFKLKFLLSNL